MLHSDFIYNWYVLWMTLMMMMLIKKLKKKTGFLIFPLDFGWLETRDKIRFMFSFKKVNMES